MDREKAWLQYFAGEGEDPAQARPQAAAPEEVSAAEAAADSALTAAEAAEREALARREAMLRRHFESVRRQSESLRELVPDFDFYAALNDPEFVRRTAPGMLPADEAYVGLHYREILKSLAERITREAREAAALSVAAGGGRPRENGSAATAAVVAAPNLQAMSPRQRKEYILGKYPRRE